MSTDHDAVRMLLGAYVLGGLSETDRRAVDTHLRTCDECRQEVTRSAPLPGLLRRAPQASTPPASQASPPMSSASLDRLLDEVRQTVVARRRKARLRWLTLAAALIIVAGLGLGLLLPTRDPDRPATTFSAAAGYAVSGHATLTAKPWGTAVTVELADLPAKGPFVLQVASADGRKEQAATWATTPTAAAAVTGATSLHIPDIRTITVLDHEGHRLATSRPS